MLILSLTGIPVLAWLALRDRRTSFQSLDKRLGRPSKLTPTTKQRIIAAIQAGVPAKTACVGCGVGESTFYGWLERAENPDSPKEYREFAEELAQARDAGQIARIARIQKAGQSDWRADAWLAERIDSVNFSARYQLGFGGNVSVNALASPCNIPEPRRMLDHDDIKIDVPEPPE